MSVKIRKQSCAGKKGFPSAKKRYSTYSVGIPHEIAELIPEDTRFEPELVEEGVLLRRVKVTALPSWVEEVRR
jgi:hypothetical protein